MPKSVVVIHVTLNGRRTTVTMDIFLSHALAARRGVEPGTPEAAKEVRKWVREAVEWADSIPPNRVSQWLARRALMEIAGERVAAAVSKFHDK